MKKRNSKVPTSVDETFVDPESADPEPERASATPDPLIGATMLDTYEIERLMGEGGMGRIYEARHVPDAMSHRHGRARSSAGLPLAQRTRKFRRADPSKVGKAQRPVRLAFDRDAACRQGIASAQGLDDVRAVAAVGGREMLPDIGRNAQVQVVLAAPATGVRDNNTGHETAPGRYSSDGLFCYDCARDCAPVDAMSRTALRRARCLARQTFTDVLTAQRLIAGAGTAPGT